MRNDFVTAIYDAAVPCNYRCIYCRNDWEIPENSLQPPFEQIRAVIDKLHDLNFKKIILTGGEFFVIPYWKEILTYVKKKNMAAWVITNAALVNPGDIPFLEELIDKINVSFHTADKKLYKKIMGTKDNSVFDKVLQNLVKLGESKIRTGIFFSPLRDNFKQFYETIQFLKESGVKLSGVNLNRIIPVQHTCTYFEEESPLSYFAHKSLIEQLIKINRELNISAYAEAYPICFLKTFIEDKELIKKINQPCFLGRKALAFNNDGSLKLCPATGFSIEEKILSDFNKNEWRHPACRECPHWKICLGGCHASRGQVYSDDSLIVENVAGLKESKISKQESFRELEIDNLRERAK